MFKSNKRQDPIANANHVAIVEAPSSPRDTTLIGAEIVLTGTLSGRGNVQVDGKVDGEVRIEGDLLVAEGALINASVSAFAIRISGSVTGNIHARKVEITSTGQVYGDLEVESLLIGEGAVYEGKSKMSSSSDARMLEASDAKQSHDVAAEA